MDQHVGDELSYRHCRERGYAPANCIVDHFPAGKDRGDICDQTLEAGGVPLSEDLFPDRFGPAKAAILDYPDGLSSQGREFREGLGEKNGAEIENLPFAGLAASNQAFRLQRRNHDRRRGWRRRPQQVEVCGKVKQANHLVCGQLLRRNIVLEGRLIEYAPERPLKIGTSRKGFFTCPTRTNSVAWNRTGTLLAASISAITMRLPSTSTTRKSNSTLGSSNRNSQVRRGSFPIFAPCRSNPVPTNRPVPSSAPQIRYAWVLPFQRRPVGERRDALVDILRSGAIALELDPLLLTTRTAQRPDQIYVVLLGPVRIHADCPRARTSAAGARVGYRTIPSRNGPVPRLWCGSTGDSTRTIAPANGRGDFESSREPPATADSTVIMRPKALACFPDLYAFANLVRITPHLGSNHGAASWASVAQQTSIRRRNRIDYRCCRPLSPK